MSKNTNGSEPEIKISAAVLDSFRKNVGRLPAETGGLLASTRDERVIDICCFDTKSQNTPGSFYYDVESMSAVFRRWKSKGYVTNGIFHSHPKGCIRPSFHDISSALLHIRFFDLDYFYLPIIQPESSGLYTLYLYVVRKESNTLAVYFEYAVKAEKKGYTMLPFKMKKTVYSIKRLDEYRSRKDSAEAVRNAPSADGYFSKVKGLYPENVLSKVIICVGTGGARSFLENCARCGFRNFILIDKDVVSPSNIATQGVYISEIGRKKVSVISERIRDINPEARVVCVDRFLDSSMSDRYFKTLMNSFPGKRPTDYLIVGCTDNFEAQKRSSMLALKFGTPYLAAMMYEKGAAAEVIFTYPGVTESCPRCLLRDRFEKYENGFQNDVGSEGCPIFATERMNALKGYIALMLLMYHDAPSSPYNDMLDRVKDRNFVWIRLDPALGSSPLGITLFDSVFKGASDYTFMDETLWIPQHPDSPEYGEEPCRLCGGTGHLDRLRFSWSRKDTRYIRFDHGGHASGF